MVWPNNCIGWFWIKTLRFFNINLIYAFVNITQSHPTYLVNSMAMCSFYLDFVWCACIGTTIVICLA